MFRWLFFAANGVFLSLLFLLLCFRYPKCGLFMYVCILDDCEVEVGWRSGMEKCDDRGGAVLRVVFGEIEFTVLMS